MKRSAMLWARVRCTGAAVVATLALAQPAAAQSTLRISGTGSGTGGMHLLADAFMHANPGVTVQVQPAVGSTGGITAVLRGRLEVAVSNRVPKDDERGDGNLVSVEFARTPFVVMVHKDLGVTALSGAQLAALYAEGAATYPNGKRARPVLRLSDSTDTKLMRSFSPAVAKALDEASSRRGMLNANTDSEAADLVEKTQGAFGGGTLAQIESERRPLVALAIDGKVPTVANLANGSYPHQKPLYLIVAKGAGPNTLKFAAFVRSAEGQKLLAAHGHLPQ